MPKSTPSSKDLLRATAHKDAVAFKNITETLLRGKLRDAIGIQKIKTGLLFFHSKKDQ